MRLSALYFTHHTFYIILIRTAPLWPPLSPGSPRPSTQYLLFTTPRPNYSAPDVLYTLLPLCTTLRPITPRPNCTACATAGTLWSASPQTLPLSSRYARAGSAASLPLTVTILYHAVPDQTRPDQTRLDRTGPDQTRPDQTRPYYTILYYDTHGQARRCCRGGRTPLRLRRPSRMCARHALRLVPREPGVRLPHYGVLYHAMLRMRDGWCHSSQGASLLPRQRHSTDKV